MNDDMKENQKIQRACCVGCKTPKGAWIYCKYLDAAMEIKKFDETGELSACEKYSIKHLLSQPKHKIIDKYESAIAVVEEYERHPDSKVGTFREFCNAFSKKAIPQETQPPIFGGSKLCNKCKKVHTGFCKETQQEHTDQTTTNNPSPDIFAQQEQPQETSGHND